jgi:predicted SnoaL-like aldol condensation-catalyzing enzyme
MKTRLMFFTSLLLPMACAVAFAQEAVVGVADPDSLFTSADPHLNVNKQAAYHIMKDLLEANHWELADKWLTAEYHQHNPNVASGRDGVVKYFTSVRKPSPVPQHMKSQIVAVVAEGDLVIVVTPRQLPAPKDPTAKYTTSWFDMWRFKDGKADEHWDGATIAAPPPAKSN